jgi:C_GCAxxG_C_C family probable redox protein
MEREGIKKRAYGHFQAGLHCAEVVSKTVLEVSSDHPHSEAVKCASGFGGGIAGTMEELCGAFTGGVIALGSLLGRENPGEELRDCGALIREFKSRFLNKFGSVNCPTLLRGVGEQEDHVDCAKLTAETAVILAELLSEFAERKNDNPDAICGQSRERVAVRRCPFGDACCH